MKWMMLVVLGVGAAAAIAQVSPEEAAMRLAQRERERAAATQPIAVREELDRLRRENADLKREIVELRKQLAMQKQLAPQVADAPKPKAELKLTIGMTQQEVAAACGSDGKVEYESATTKDVTYAIPGGSIRTVRASFDDKGKLAGVSYERRNPHEFDVPPPPPPGVRGGPLPTRKPGTY